MKTAAALDVVSVKFIVAYLTVLTVLLFMRSKSSGLRLMIDVVEPELVKVGCLEGAGMRVTEVDKRVAPVGDERDWVLNSG